MRPNYLIGQNSGGPQETTCGSYRGLEILEKIYTYLCLPRIELWIVEYTFYNTFYDNFRPFLYEDHMGRKMSNSANYTTNFSGSSTGWSVRVLIGQKALIVMGLRKRY
jgi:hypothetical protein